MAADNSKQSKKLDAVEVWLDADILNGLIKIGNLKHDRGQFYFSYDENWLKNPAAFNIDPDLHLVNSVQPAPDSKFKVFMDSAPDRWGRLLMDRREVVNSVIEKRPARSLMEWDYLLGVQDQTRMGAIRLKDENGVFIDHKDYACPPVTSLQELHDIARDLENSDFDDLPELSRWLSSMLAPGASLGGARPKANFMEADGTYWIAKFPSGQDRVDIGLWEAVTHQLAKVAGIQVPSAKVVKIKGDHHTFCVQRFDREDGRRKMFVSAMTMLGKKDGEDASYVDMAEFITSYGATKADGHGVNADLEQLWRRMVFNVMTSNRDDHLRNHGFIMTNSGWSLAPAYDMNPNAAKREHAIALDIVDATPSLVPVFAAAEWFRVSPDRAILIAEQVRAAVNQWEATAIAYGVKRMELIAMSPAFTIAREPLPEFQPVRKSKRMKY